MLLSKLTTIFSFASPFFTLLSYLFFTKIGSADIVCTLLNLAHYPYLFAPQKG